MTKIYFGDKEWELDENKPIIQIIGYKDETGNMTAILHHNTIRIITRRGRTLVAPPKTVFRIHETQILADAFKRGDFVNCKEEIKCHE